jgi:acyl-CoA reductase-like NAD-dependent aldehyde dehydrogenase
VLCILTYRDEDEAVAIDNDYGLTSYAFSSEPPRAWAT